MGDTTDYHKFTTKETTKEERKRLNVGDIYINAIECGACGDVIRSKNRHDFRGCRCGKVAVDGGSWYLRRVGEGWIERSVYFSDVEQPDQKENSDAGQ